MLTCSAMCVHACEPGGKKEKQWLAGSTLALCHWQQRADGSGLMAYSYLKNRNEVHGPKVMTVEGGSESTGLDPGPSVTGL